jgi:hypothetical protein
MADAEIVQPVDQTVTRLLEGLPSKLVRFPAGAEIVLCVVLGPALGPTRPPNQWIPRHLFWRINRKTWSSQLCASCWNHAEHLVPEDEEDVLLRNVGWLSANYTTLGKLQNVHKFEIAGNVKFMKNSKTKFWWKQSWTGSTQVHAKTDLACGRTFISYTSNSKYEFRLLLPNLERPCACWNNRVRVLNVIYYVGRSRLNFWPGWSTVSRRLFTEPYMNGERIRLYKI